MPRNVLQRLKIHHLTSSSMIQPPHINQASHILQLNERLGVEKYLKIFHSEKKRLGGQFDRKLSLHHKHFILLCQLYEVSAEKDT